MWKKNAKQAKTNKTTAQSQIKYTKENQNEVHTEKVKKLFAKQLSNGKTIVTEKPELLIIVKSNEFSKAVLPSLCCSLWPTT
jgi:hypothetical protein